MKLRKFPVISKKGNQYEVHVYDEHFSIGIAEWVVKVYIRKERLLNKSKYKLISVYEWTSGWRKYDDYIGKYKEMAIITVEKYERLIEENRQERIKYKEGIEEFEKWDGRIL